MHHFQQERVRSITGQFTAVINKATADDFIAIDDEGKAGQEYFDCCRPSPLGLNLNDWLADQIVSGIVKLKKMDHSQDDTLRRLGLPKKDIKWPSIALGSASSHIVTEDIDLFEPSAKAYDAKSKNKIKTSGNGVVAKHLRKNFNITVCTSESFLSL